MRRLITLLTIFCAIGHLQTPDLAADETPAAAKLPKVVLIGDSVRLSYASTVSKELEGKATVVSPQPNGGDSNNVVKHLQAWVIAEQPDVAHFNCGIHDTKKFKQTGKFQVSPEQYEQNLRKIVTDIRSQTDAVVLFATSTPIVDDRAAKVRADRDYELLNASIEQYNAIALEVMKELKVPVNDLNAALAEPEPPLKTADLIVADGVHLTEPARQLLGRKVANAISRQLTEKSE